MLFEKDNISHLQKELTQKQETSEILKQELLDLNKLGKELKEKISEKDLILHNLTNNSLAKIENIIEVFNDISSDLKNKLVVTLKVIEEK